MMRRRALRRLLTMAFVFGTAGEHLAGRLAFGAKRADLEPQACAEIDRGARPSGEKKAITTGIRGRVTDENGVPIEGMIVADYSGSPYPETFTNADGTYELETPPGLVQLNACDCGSFVRYVDVWHPNVWDSDYWRNLVPATVFSVSEGQVIDGVDFRVPLAGTIGVSLRDGGGNPIDADRGDGSGWGSYGSLFFEREGGRYLMNDGPLDFNNGSYQSYVIPVGTTMFLRARPQGTPFVPEYYEDRTSLGEATPIPIVAPTVHPVTVVLEETGSEITGTIGFSAPPSSVTYRYVEIMAASQFPGSYYDVVYADAAGNYELAGIPDGDYKLRCRARFRPIAGQPSVTTTKYSVNSSTFVGGEVIQIRGGNASLVRDFTADVAPTVDTIVVNRTALPLAALAGTTGPAEELQLWTTNPSVDWSATTSATWVRVTPESGNLRGSGLAQTLQVWADATGLAAGVHSGFLSIVDVNGGSTLFIAVTATVAEAPQSVVSLTMSPSMLEFFSTVPQYSPQSVELRNGGGSAVDWAFRSGVVELYPPSGRLAAGESVVLTAAVANGAATVEFGSVTGTLECLVGPEVAVVVPVSVTTSPAPVAGDRLGTGGRVRGGRIPDGLVSRTVPIISSKTPGWAGSSWSSDVQIGDVAQMTGATRSQIEGPPVDVDAIGQLTVFFTEFGKTNGADSLVIAGEVTADVTTFGDPTGNAFRQIGKAGVLEFRFDSGNPTGIWTRSWTPARDGRGTYGQEVPAAESRSLITGGEVAVLPVVISGSSFRTNLIVAETAGSAADVDVRLFSPEGAQLGDPISISLAALEQKVIGSSYLSRAADLAWAEVEVSGTGIVAVMGSLVDQESNDPTTIFAAKSAVLSRSGRIVLPSVAHAPGLAGTNWRSDVWLVNSGNVEVTLSLRLATGPGTMVDGRTFVLGPKMQVVLTDVVLSEFGIDNGKGTLVVGVESGPSSGVHASCRIYNDSPEGTFGQGVWPIAQEREVVVGDSGIAMFGLEKTALSRSNLLVTETSGVPVTASVSGNGRKIVRTLAAWETWQVSDVLGALGIAKGRTGVSLSVRAEEGAGAVSSFASVVDAFTGDGTTVPGYTGAE